MMVTTSGSMGSGSVPVIPSVVEVGEVVEVEELVVCPVLEANARSTGLVSNARSTTTISF
jgi:hypothetical protein